HGRTPYPSPPRKRGSRFESNECCCCIDVIDDASIRRFAIAARQNIDCRMPFLAPPSRLSPAEPASTEAGPRLRVACAGVTVIMGGAMAKCDTPPHKGERNSARACWIGSIQLRHICQRG